MVHALGHRDYLQDKKGISCRLACKNLLNCIEAPHFLDDRQGFS